MAVRSYTYADWLKLVSGFGWKCFWCAKPLTEKTVTKDHRQPISRGGTDCLSNIVPCCHKCNSMKGNKNEAEFCAYLHRTCGKKRTGISLEHYWEPLMETETPLPALPFETCENPELLRALQKERDGYISWDWNHPARETRKPSPEARAVLDAWLAKHPYVKEAE